MDMFFYLINTFLLLLMYSPLVGVFTCWPWRLKRRVSVLWLSNSLSDNVTPSMPVGSSSPRMKHLACDVPMVAVAADLLTYR